MASPSRLKAGWHLAQKRTTETEAASEAAGSWLTGVRPPACSATALVASLAAAFTSTAPAAVRTPALLVCSAAYGLALAWAGVQIEAREAEGRLPELCQTAVRSTV